jgi:hypothetical protein
MQEGSRVCHPQLQGGASEAKIHRHWRGWQCGIALARKPQAARHTHQSLSAIEEESLDTLTAATKEVSSVTSITKSPPESKASADQNLSPNEDETINTVSADTKEVSSVPSLQKSGQKKKSPRYDLMDSSDSLGVHTNAIKSPEIAEAASTLIYQLQYGKDNNTNKS